MTIPKAIEILHLNINERHSNMPPDVLAALKLAIEALKAWKQFREGRWVSGRYDLPGEDPE